MAAKRDTPIALPKPIVDCAYHGCNTPAILREKTETGWANLCEFHWVKAATERSEKRCRDMGLVTKQDKITYCRSVLGGLARRMEREPGCDDEPERRYMPGVKAKEVAGA
jgi:hypothetical protein